MQSYQDDLEYQTRRSLQVPGHRKEAIDEIPVYGHSVWTRFHTGPAKFHQTNAFTVLDAEHELNPAAESAHGIWDTARCRANSWARLDSGAAGRKPDTQSIVQAREGSILAPRSSCFM